MMRVTSLARISLWTEDVPEEYLLVSFGLSHQSDSPRVWQSVEAYPGRWTHHAIVAREQDLDGELLALIDEAYHFAMVK